jgi:hypothetical protein
VNIRVSAVPVHGDGLGVEPFGLDHICADDAAVYAPGFECRSG